jgi:hypothetical protein
VAELRRQLRQCQVGSVSLCLFVCVRLCVCVCGACVCVFVCFRDSQCFINATYKLSNMCGVWRAQEERNALQVSACF